MKNKRKKSLLRRNKQLFKLLIFIIKFNLLAIPLYLIILSGFEWGFLIDTTTSASFSLLKLTGIEAERTGNLITIPIQNGSFAAFINWDCTGWKSMFALFALMFATDFSLRKKLFGLLLLPVVYLINLLRILFMFHFISTYGLAYYDIVHATIWSWGLIATIMILWLLWMKSPLKISLGKKYIPTRIK